MDVKNQKNETEFPYLHGFTPEEQDRLIRQAAFAEHMVYQNINFSDVDHLLEVGCGVGAQSEILLRRFPKLMLTGIDLSDDQLKTAEEYLSKNPTARGRYELKKMNAAQMEFTGKKFDGAFLCFLLEHVPKPQQVLSEVRRALVPGSRVYITEVMNNTFFLEPYSPNLWKYWLAFNDHQHDLKGDPFIGAKLGNLLLGLGFRNIQTTFKTWHLDNREPRKRKEMIEFWAELLLSGAPQMIEAGVVTKELVENMRKELKDVGSDPNAVFMYSLMQAEALV